MSDDESEKSKKEGEEEEEVEVIAEKFVEIMELKEGEHYPEDWIFSFKEETTIPETLMRFKY